MRVCTNNEHAQPYALDTNEDYRKEVATALADCHVGLAAAGALHTVLRSEAWNKGRLSFLVCLCRGNHSFPRIA